MIKMNAFASEKCSCEGGIKFQILSIVFVWALGEDEMVACTHMMNSFVKDLFKIHGLATNQKLSGISTRFATEKQSVPSQWEAALSLLLLAQAANAMAATCPQ